jgi:hypothetical protein
MFGFDFSEAEEDWVNIFEVVSFSIGLSIASSLTSSFLCKALAI